MKKHSKSATELKALIKHAISDLEVTQDEYRRILAPTMTVIWTMKKARSSPSSTR